jgi:lysophospholipase L1-like esterase
MHKRMRITAVLLGAAILVLSLIGTPAPGSAAAAPADRDPDQYVAFGDSITYGLGSFGYPPRLETLLIAKYGAAKVWNAGIGGEGTTDGLARIDYILSGTNSKYLLLMEGTNDAANLLMSIATVDANLREMCRRAVAAGWTPVLATITPRSDWIWYVSSYRARFDELNARIRQIAVDLGLTLADAYAAFMAYPASSGGYTSLLFDGVHPNSTGYQVLAEAWFAALKIAKFNPPRPPIQAALETRLDASETGKINTLIWQANPLNASMALKGYAIYRKPAAGADSTFSRIGSVSASVFRYEDAGLDVPVKYAYRVTALSAVSDESDPSATVFETVSFAFPPLNPSVRTFPGGGGGIGKKINVVAFEPNPLNESAMVGGYRVYRKKSGESDDRYAAVAFLGASTYRVVDPFVPSVPKYLYAVATVYSDGQESRKSAPVSDR